MKMEELNECVGLKIKKLRKEKNLTQEKFTEILHIDLRHFRRIESGKKTATLKLLNNISECFNVDISYFFIDQGKSHKVKKILFIFEEGST